MAAPHPGKWSPVFETTVPPVPPKVVLNTQKVAVHASVIYKPGLSPFPWKVLYFSADVREDPDGENLVRSRIWDPNNPGEAPVYQNIPNWPSIGPPGRCAASSMLRACSYVKRKTYICGRSARHRSGTCATSA